MRVADDRLAILVLAFVLAIALSAWATRALADSGSPSGLVVRDRDQRVEPVVVAFCPGRGSLASCFATGLPFKFGHRLRLDGDSRRLLLRSTDLEPTSRGLGMATRRGRSLGRDLRVVALDRGRRVPDAGYVGHRRWRIELPRRLPRGLYMITGEVSYPGGAFYDFAFGASSEDAD